MRSPRNKTRIFSEKRFAMFDFSEDDERVEKTDRNLRSKFNFKRQKKSSFDPPVDKYTFLEVFSKGAKNEQKNTANVPFYVDDSDDGTEERVIRLDSNVSSGAKSRVPRTSRFEGNSNCCLPKTLVDIEPVSLDSDDDHSTESSLSPPAPDLARCGGLSEADVLDVDCILCDTEKTVVITPDYIIYLNMYSKKALLTFSSQGIKLEGSTHIGASKSFSYEWAISEIASIESVWSESVKMAEMSLCHRSKVMKLDDKANESSGIMKLTFAVTDSHWYQTEEAIKSLDLRYRATWNTVLDIDTLKSEEVSLSKNGVLCLEHNCPPEPGKVVVYPEGDPDPVSISKSEVELLKPETFINDTIVDFYIKHLVSRISPTERQRFHFFNSFFFRKLADLDKYSSRPHEGRADFQRVRKWTKKVNLFEKDFIFIPVNFSLHWSLIVICHPGKVVKPRDEGMETSSRAPCILHMDSIKGSHSGLRNLFQSYLREEWKARHEEAVEDVSTRIRDLCFIPLELPQQQNSYDCGLFLLHYVELFLEKALVEANPFNLMLNSSFLQKSWFQPADASAKRAHVRRLICETIGYDPCDDPIAASECKSSLPDVSDGNNYSDISWRDIYGAREGYSCNYPEFNPDQEAPTTSRVATPLNAMQCSGQSSFGFGDIIRPEKFDQPDSYRNIPHKAQVVNILSPIVEGKEVDEQTSLACTKKAECQQGVDVISTPTKCFSKSPVNLEEDDPMESSPGPGVSPGRHSALVEEQNDEDCAIVIVIDASSERPFPLVKKQNNEDCVPEKTKYDYSLISSGELLACVIEDSDEEEEPNSVNEEVDSNDYTDNKASQTQNLYSRPESKSLVHRKDHRGRSLYEDLE